MSDGTSFEALVRFRVMPIVCTLSTDRCNGLVEDAFRLQRNVEIAWEMKHATGSPTCPGVFIVSPFGPSYQSLPGFRADDSHIGIKRQ